MQAIITFKDISQSKIIELKNTIQSENSMEINQQTRSPIQGEKPIDIITALTVASIGLSLISTFISALALYGSKNPTYSISIKHGNITETIGNIRSIHQINEIIRNLESESSNDIQISVSKE